MPHRVPNLVLMLKDVRDQIEEQNPVILNRRSQPRGRVTCTLPWSGNPHSYLRGTWCPFTEAESKVIDTNVRHLDSTWQNCFSGWILGFNKVGRVPSRGVSHES